MKATPKQRQYIYDLCKHPFYTVEKEAIEEKLGCTFEELTKERASEVLDILTKPTGFKEFFNK